MKKYGEFVVFPTDFKEFTIVIEYKDQILNFDPGAINISGKCIKTVRTIEKACRLIRKYEKKMGRIL